MSGKMVLLRAMWDGSVPIDQERGQGGGGVGNRMDGHWLKRILKESAWRVDEDRAINPREACVHGSNEEAFADRHFY